MRTSDVLARTGQKNCRICRTPTTRAHGNGLAPARTCALFAFQCLDPRAHEPAFIAVRGERHLALRLRRERVARAPFDLDEVGLALADREDGQVAREPL